MLLRRAISGVLCWLMVLPAIAALRTPDVPACCRRDGAHHCAMSMMVDNMPSDGASSAASGTAHIGARNECPLHRAARITASSPAMVFPRALLSTPDAQQGSAAPARHCFAANARLIRAGRAPPSASIA